MATERVGRRWLKQFLDDPGDGLNINNLNYQRNICNKSSRISIFDETNIVINVANRDGNTGYKFRKVSVMGEVRRANVLRFKHTNKYKDEINGE